MKTRETSPNCDKRDATSYCIPKKILPTAFLCYLNSSRLQKHFFCKDSTRDFFLLRLGFALETCVALKYGQQSDKKGKLLAGVHTCCSYLNCIEISNISGEGKGLVWVKELRVCRGNLTFSCITERDSRGKRVSTYWSYSPNYLKKNNLQEKVYILCIFYIVYVSVFCQVIAYTT